MKAYRIHITSWTAGFRYPNLISGFQPSLPVPPLSTLYGLISAAAGNYISARDIPLGYVFRSGGQTVDLETIYQFSAKSPLKTKSNVIRRQILFDTELWLYLNNEDIADCFQTPEFQLLMGRSGDLASVKSIRQIDLKSQNELDNLRGMVVPVKTVPMGAPIQALPISFTNEVPRRSLGTHPFFMLDYDYNQTEPLSESGFLDEESTHQIFWHDYRTTLNKE